MHSLNFVTQLPQCISLILFIAMLIFKDVLTKHLNKTLKFLSLSYKKLHLQKDIFARLGYFIHALSQYKSCVISKLKNPHMQRTKHSALSLLKTTAKLP